MKTLHFDNGDRMPILGLGTWKSKPGQANLAVKEAIRLGYRHIDCAPIYGNETEIGKALAESFKDGVAARDQMWITSKLWNDAHEPEDVQPALEKTLTDLNLDYLDLYLIHWPVALKKGASLRISGKDFIPLDLLPISKTWEAMEAMVEKGLCRHIGVSNFSVFKLKALFDGARLKPEINQIELHPYLQQPAMLDFCSRNRIHLTAYSPLGSSDRPAVLKEKDEPVLLVDAAIGAIAERRGVTPAQVLISWAIHRGTAVIPKSVNPARIKQNLAAAEVPLTDEDMREIAELDRHRRYVNGRLWTIEGSPHSATTLWDE